MQCVLQISVGLIPSSQDKRTEFTLLLLNTGSTLSIGEKGLRTEDIFFSQEWLIVKSDVCVSYLNQDAKPQFPHLCNEDSVVWETPNC